MLRHTSAGRSGELGLCLGERESQYINGVPGAESLKSLLDFRERFQGLEGSKREREKQKFLSKQSTYSITRQTIDFFKRRLLYVTVCVVRRPNAESTLLILFKGSGSYCSSAEH